MSRCRNCNNEFRETSGWQEFCSLACAKEYHIPMKPPKPGKLATKRYTKALQEFKKKLENPKFARLIRMDGKKEKKAEVGKNSDIVIRPMTDTDRELIELQKRHSGFSDNHKHHISEDLPGAHGLVGLGWEKHD